MYRSATPNAYRESAVLTASPVQLVVMLYDGANRFLKQASVLYDQGDQIEAGQRLGRAQAIVEELLATLDLERGGDVAPRLQGIYVYCLREMSTARVEKSSARLAEVAGHLAELRESWAELAARQG
ncbi:MAG: flagellar export chaperone FliS [Solirubrobacteraceae bacterium]|nr:flagellar export chaperone FliS [Solirubrobacteraceae bacterium]